MEGERSTSVVAMWREGDEGMWLRWKGWEREGHYPWQCLGANTFYKIQRHGSILHRRDSVLYGLPLAFDWLPQ